MTIAILGAGAIGGSLAGYLIESKQDVILIDFWPENVETINSSGLHFTTPEKEFHIPAKAIHPGQMSSLKEDFDYAILAVKSYDTEWCTQLIKPYLKPNGFIMSAQNSINEETIANIVGWSKVIGCILLFGAEVYAPGKIRQTSAYNKMLLGEPSGLITNRLEKIKESLANSGEINTTTNLWGERWAKLATNSMSNSLAGITNLGSSEIRNNPKVRHIMINIASEVVNVAYNLGVNVEPIGHAPAKLFANAPKNKSAYKKVVEYMTAYTQIVGGGRPSLAQDLSKGRHIEVDYLNGYVVNKAIEAKVDVPVNTEIVELAHSIANGTPAGISNINNLLSMTNY